MCCVYVEIMQSWNLADAETVMGHDPDADEQGEAYPCI